MLIADISFWLQLLADVIKVLIQAFVIKKPIKLMFNDVPSKKKKKKREEHFQMTFRDFALKSLRLILQPLSQRQTQ